MKIRVTILLMTCVLLVAPVSFAQSRAAKTQPRFVQPAGLTKSPNYTHVVIVQPGKLVFVSGQVAFNAAGEVVGKGDLEAQVTQVMENLKTALAAAGATMEDVIKLNWYVVNLKPEQLPIIRGVRAKYFPAERPPASTLVGVTALAGPDLLLEVEAVAAIK